MKNHMSGKQVGNLLYLRYVLTLFILMCTVVTFAQPHYKVNNAKAVPTITSHEAIRIEGTWFVLDYGISGTSIQGTGVCWGTTHNPDTTNDKTVRLSPTGTQYTDTCSANLAVDGVYYARAYAYNVDGIIYGTEDTIYTQYYTEPTAVTNITTTSIDSTSIGFTWDDNDSKAYVIKIAPGTSEPSMSEFVDTTSPAPYFLCSSTGDPTDIREIFNNVLSGTKHSLEKDSTYTFKFIPLNDPGIYSGTDHNYRQDPNTYVTFKTVKGKPTTQASNISFSNITSSSFSVSWTNGNGEKRVVYMNTSKTFTGPSDKTEPTVNTIWSNAGEQCVYNGTGSQVTVTSIKDSVTYFFHVYEANNSNSSIYFKTSDYTNNPDSLIAPVSYWRGGSTVWETNTNWSQSLLPVSSQNIIITNTTNKPVVASNVTVNNVTIKPSGVLTVDNNYTLSITNNLTIESDATGDGSLVIIRNGATSISGTSTINRYVGDGNWHYLSNPTENTTINVLAGYYANEYSESGAAFQYLTASSTIDKVHGYSIKNAHVGVNDTLTFTGAFNNGSQSITVTNANVSDDTYGWNLVGNPYPCAIDWDASLGWTRADINATAYYYNGTGYVDWNYSSGTGSGSKIIPMGQGFFVFSTVSSTTFGMDNNVRTSSYQSYYKRNSTDKTIIQLQLANDSLSDRTSLVFMDGASEDFDISDGHKLFSGATYIPELYSLTNGYELSINSLSRTLLDSADNTYKIPIAFISQLETDLTFSISDYENVPDSIKFTLIDKYTYDTIDIENNTYTFSTDTGSFADRFALKIDKVKSTTGIESLNSGVSVYIASNMLIVNQNNPQNNAQIIVSDVLGRILINKSLTQENKQFIKLPRNNNIFVINIYSKNEILLRKTVIKHN